LPPLWFAWFKTLEPVVVFLTRTSASNDFLAESCKHLSINQMAAGSRLPRDFLLYVSVSSFSLNIFKKASVLLTFSLDA